MGQAVVFLVVIFGIFWGISSLFTKKGRKKESAGSEPKLAWNPQLFEESTPKLPTEYTYDGLPPAVRVIEKFSILRFDGNDYGRYKPYLPRIIISEPTSWKSRSGQYTDRIHKFTRNIDWEDLSEFCNVAAETLTTRIDRDVLETRAAIGRYPTSRPRASNKVNAPDELTPFSVEALLPDHIRKILTANENLYLQGFIASVNSKREKHYKEAMSQYEKVFLETKKKLENQHVIWQSASDNWDKACAEDEHALIAIKERVCSSLSIQEIVKFALTTAPFPVWFPTEFNISFDHKGKILIVEHQMPHLDEIEWVKRVALKNTDSIKPLNVSERKKVCSEFYPLLTLSLASLLAKNLDADDVSLVVVNGWVNFRSKATGTEKMAFCSSLAASTKKLQEIDLKHADPLTAYKTLKGLTTPSLELAPVAPKMRLNMEDKRFIEAREILEGVDQDENLASMDWADFEHLCRELFERVFASEGATVSVTQASHDQGVDAIILDPDPILGGKIVIQAKRYVNTVDVSAVRELLGVVTHEGAMKGLLVTTSQFGPESYEFAQKYPLTLINGSELLHLLEKHGYKFRINLEEARVLQRESGMPSFRKRGMGSKR